MHLSEKKVHIVYNSDENVNIGNDKGIRSEERFLLLSRIVPPLRKLQIEIFCLNKPVTRIVLETFFIKT